MLITCLGFWNKIRSSHLHDLKIHARITESVQLVTEVPSLFCASVCYASVAFDLPFSG